MIYIAPASIEQERVGTITSTEVQRQWIFYMGVESEIVAITDAFDWLPDRANPVCDVILQLSLVE